MTMILVLDLKSCSQTLICWLLFGSSAARGHSRTPQLELSNEPSRESVSGRARPDEGRARHVANLNFARRGRRQTRAVCEVDLTHCLLLRLLDWIIQAGFCGWCEVRVSHERALNKLSWGLLWLL